MSFGNLIYLVYCSLLWTQTFYFVEDFRCYKCSYYNDSAQLDMYFKPHESVKLYAIHACS